jgi:hypothetical protein
MGLGAAFVADVESSVLVQPGEGAFDDPAPAAQSGAVLGRAACDQRPDAERADLAPVELLVVAAVGDQLARTSLRRAAAAADRRDRLEQQQELRPVVAVGAGQRPGEWDAAAVGQQVVLGAVPAAVDRTRPGRGAPCFAWM